MGVPGVADFRVLLGATARGMLRSCPPCHNRPMTHTPPPEALAAVLESLVSHPGLGAAALKARRLLAERMGPASSDPDRPLVVVFMGPSGTGKSTLINSLADRTVTAAGSRRPTTTEPVAWTGGPMPPVLDGIRSRLPGLLVETLKSPPGGVVLIDSPPPGIGDGDGTSVVEELIDAADGVVLVASARRYADEAGLALARRARRRGSWQAFVLNRLPTAQEDQGPLVADFAAKLAQAEVIPSGDPGVVIAVEEFPADGGSRLPDEAVIGLSKELDHLCDPVVRQEVLQSVAAGARRELHRLLAGLRAALVDAEAERAARLDAAALAYAGAARTLAVAIDAGEYAPGSDPDEMFALMATAVTRHAGRAALRTAHRWEELGDRLPTSMWVHDPETPGLAAERFAWWQGEVLRRAGAHGLFWGRRRRRRLMEALCRAVADPAAAVTPAQARLIDRHPGGAAAARDSLLGEIEGVLQADRARFTGSLGGPSRPEALESLTLEAG